jgi:hypothetical protein
MKRISIILLGFFLTLSFSCNFSKGVKKDLSSGLSASYNGFAIDDIYLTDAGGTRLSNNKISLGSKIAVTASGVDYFEVKDGKVFPGCRIILTDKNKKEILNLPDAFTDMTNGTTPAEAKVLQAYLTTGSPMAAGETYHLSVRFFDKNKAASEIIADVDLLMKE